ncbi:hypothetical protein CC1G_13728 [Coprinopsis cinerea okayama7|uniref:Uncharacterized protein n=1 Tax=Coprinopsis cinerea (strain Okayama-7 / 130 / ATCC MYA-4618 / FGSC 9003) TaxID=240176 RepID=D6RK69_COPC7|nr:hypothetical protein CC1G_13728 [Coprinopsis cinerea okayama7\|eukprot:XP_002912196.1 hypothetical protein CC1G_13728 [Coprinopsis cinerea okayama7\
MSLCRISRQEQGNLSASVSARARHGTTPKWSEPGDVAPQTGTEGLASVSCRDRKHRPVSAVHRKVVMKRTARLQEKGSRRGEVGPNRRARR